MILIIKWHRFSKKGSNLKGKLPFICFRCGKMGYYVAKCTLKDESGHEEESKKRTFKNRGSRKKNVFSKHDSDVSNEEDYDENKQILFMVVSNEAKSMEEMEKMKVWKIWKQNLLVP